MMSPNTRFSPIFLFLLGAASFVIVVAGMQSASSLLNAFFLSLIIVITVSPLLGWLVHKGLSPKLALLLTILLVLGAGASLIAFLGVSINQLIHILPTYEARISAIKDSLVHFFAAKGININNTMGSDVLQPSYLLKGAVVFIQRIGEAIASSFNFRQHLLDNREDIYQESVFIINQKTSLILQVFPYSLERLLDKNWLPS